MNTKDLNSTSPFLIINPFLRHTFSHISSSGNREAIPSRWEFAQQWENIPCRGQNPAAVCSFWWWHHSAVIGGSFSPFQDSSLSPTPAAWTCSDLRDNQRGVSGGCRVEMWLVPFQKHYVLEHLGNQQLGGTSVPDWNNTQIPGQTTPGGKNTQAWESLEA